MKYQHGNTIALTIQQNDDNNENNTMKYNAPKWRNIDKHTKLGILVIQAKDERRLTSGTPHLEAHSRLPVGPPWNYRDLKVGIKLQPFLDTHNSL